MNTIGCSAFLDQIGIGSFDWGYLAVGMMGLAIVMLIVLILLIVQIVKVNKLKKDWIGSFWERTGQAWRRIS